MSEDLVWLPAGLRPYCLYEHEDRGADLGDLIGDRSYAVGLRSIARDCMAVVPAAAATLTPERREAFERRFLTQAGGLAAVGSPSAEDIRLAVVDTMPSGEDPARGIWNSPHGYVMASLAEKLLCDSAGACQADVAARLTLRYVSFHRWSKKTAVRDDVRGGFVGFISELAEDLWAETDIWRRQPAAGRPRLILNLSLGWDGRFNESGGVERPAVTAVRDALLDAVCRGALPVAAAGNHEWGPEGRRGPLYPAAWELEPAPELLECGVAIAPDAPLANLDDGAYRPLVFAVGAVRADGSRLPIARPDAEPRLVAFGDHALVRTARPEEPVSPLTGTSVAALVVSATAAAAWSERPDLNAFRLMDEIYAASQPRPGGVSRVAEFTFDRTPNPEAGADVRRVYTCPVALSLCESSPAAVACPSCRPEVANPRQPLCPDGLAAGGRFPAARCAPLPRLSPGLKSKVFAGAASVDLASPGAGWTESASWPADELPALWANLEAGPQPGSEICPTCGIEDSSPGTAYVELDSLFAARNPRLSTPALKAGDRVFLLDLDLDTRTPGYAVIHNVPLGEPVYFTVVVDGRLAATSLLFGPESLEEK